jgi:hypothetical protein
MTLRTNFQTFTTRVRSTPMGASHSLPPNVDVDEALVNVTPLKEVLLMLMDSKMPTMVASRV